MFSLVESPHQHTFQTHDVISDGLEMEPGMHVRSLEQAAHEPNDIILKPSNLSTIRKTALECNSVSSSERIWYSPVKSALQYLIPYGSIAANVFGFCSVTLGGGIISMPSSFATSGIVMAIIYLVVITIMSIYTITLMAYAMERTGYKNYEDMGRGLFGRWGGLFSGGIMALSCVGTAIAYIQAMCTLIDPILQKAPHMPSYLKTVSGNRLITTLIWLVFMLPVIIPKRVNSLRYASAISVSMVIYFVLTIVVHSSLNGIKLGMRDDMTYFTTGNKAIYGLSIFVFAYMCQGPAYSIYYEMRPKPSVRQLTIASIIGLTLCMFLYILSGLFGYFDFAGETKESILSNFDPINQPYIMVAYVGMLVKICTAFAMNMIPIRNFVYYCLNLDLDTVPYWKHTLCVVTFATTLLLAGLFIPSVNLAFGLVGSLTGGFIGFIFPAYFWMYCGNWSLKTVGIWHYLGTYLLIISGVIAIVFGSIATIYSTPW